MGAADDGLYHHSLKRCKKRINDFILHNYMQLFFQSSTKNTPQATDLSAPAGIPMDSMNPSGKASPE